MHHEREALGEQRSQHQQHLLLRCGRGCFSGDVKANAIQPVGSSLNARILHGVGKRHDLASGHVRRDHHASGPRRETEVFLARGVDLD